MLDNPNVSMLKMLVNQLDRVLGPPPNPSIEEDPNKLKLKPLPSHLRHVFLGINKTLPVILSFSLSVA